ncbi:MAG: FHA domain-containing protein, partial [Myxococcales bacterium]|nr:FHA domain-containing protein [Myxococcales bacterium]
RNGTYVNGARLTKRQRLSPGDVIRVGGTLVVYALADRITEGAPLRERRQAIVPVIRGAVPDVELDADAVEALLLHDWPGDEDELRQVVQAAAPAAGEHLGLAHLPEALRPMVEERARGHAEGLARLVSGSLARPTLPPLASRVDRERGPGHDHLVAALREHGFNVARCARYFSVSRRDVYRWIEAEALDLEALRDDRVRLTEALERAGGRATVAAELMGVDRKTIYRMAQREGIDLEVLER